MRVYEIYDEDNQIDIGILLYYKKISYILSSSDLILTSGLPRFSSLLLSKREYIQFLVTHSGMRRVLCDIQRFNRYTGMAFV